MSVMIEGVEVKYSIEMARKLFLPSEVRGSEEPKWLKKRIRAYVRMRKSIVDVDVPFHRIWDLGWRDHCGIVECPKCPKHQCFVSEPYDFIPDQARSLDQFCNDLCCFWIVSSNSWHFPGRTVRIEIHSHLDD